MTALAFASVSTRLLNALANPGFDVLLLLLGILLLYVEFNRPGSVLPVCLGTFLILLSLFGLHTFPVRRYSIALLLFALTTLILETRFATRGLFAVAGTAALLIGILQLVIDPPIPPMLAIPSALLFAAISFTLAATARNARLNKHIPLRTKDMALPTSVTPNHPSAPSNPE